MKIQLLESKQRSILFKETPLKYIYVLLIDKQLGWMVNKLMKKANHGVQQCV